jgi:membrane associated rhomboid family serine protease
MTEYDPGEDQQPVTWVRGHPIYAAHFIVVALVASMLATTILMAFGATRFLGPLPFTSAGVLRGEAWRIATYGFVNPPSLWFAVDMAMIALFGREVEKFFGRRKFLTLYGSIYLLPPVLFTLLGPWLPAQLSGETGAFALFVAFAALYPDAVMLFGILAKWAAVALVGIFSLMALAYRDWIGGLSLWATAGLAFAFVRYEQGRLTLPRFSLFRRRPRLRVFPDIERGGTEGARPLGAEPMAEVDALLDKIARSGISSLTAAERARLDSARDELVKRETRRR